MMVVRNFQPAQNQWPAWSESMCIVPDSYAHGEWKSVSASLLRGKPANRASLRKLKRAIISLALIADNANLPVPYSEAWGSTCVRIRCLMQLNCI
jgi:hypothetical protein